MPTIVKYSFHETITALQLYISQPTKPLPLYKLIVKIWDSADQIIGEYYVVLGE